MNRLILTLPLLLLAACASETITGDESGPIVEAPAEPGFPGPTGDDPCGAYDYKSFVGTNIAAVTMPAELNARVLRPGQITTMEYISGRMTIRVDEDGVIQSVSCG